MATWLYTVTLFALAAGALAGRIKYNTAGGPVEGMLNVHIVPHTHDGRGLGGGGSFVEDAVA